MGEHVERIAVECAFGTLVAEVAGDPGVYDEIEIDLVLPSGELMQLVVAGTGPGPDGTRDPDGSDLHVYVWDGTDESPSVFVHPNMETAVWY